jgi:hypothetical protein
MNPEMSHYFDARGVTLTRGEDPIFPAPRCMTCSRVELMRPPVTPYLAVKLPLATNRRPTVCDECTQPPRDQTKPKSIVGQTATSLPDWAMSALPSTPEAISAFPIGRRVFKNTIPIGPRRACSGAAAMLLFCSGVLDHQGLGDCMHCRAVALERPRQTMHIKPDRPRGATWSLDDLRAWIDFG